jgi:hypothetical protein
MEITNATNYLPFQNIFLDNKANREKKENIYRKQGFVKNLQCYAPIKIAPIFGRPFILVLL